MARTNPYSPWLALMALAILGLSIRLMLWPLPLSAPQPQIAHTVVHCRPATASGLAASVCLPAAPAWPTGHAAPVSPALSLSQIAG